MKFGKKVLNSLILDNPYESEILKVRISYDYKRRCKL